MTQNRGLYIYKEHGFIKRDGINCWELWIVLGDVTNPVNHSYMKFNAKPSRKMISHQLRKLIYQYKLRNQNG